MASFDMPVGTVRRTQAWYDSRGSRRRLQPCRGAETGGSVWGFLRRNPDRCIPSAGGGATHVVEVYVHAAVVGQHKVADGICALDRMRVALKRGQEGGVLRLDEIVGLVICPEL